MTKKRIFEAIAVFVILAAGISLAFAAPKKSAAKPRLSVVATIFPEYDWAREILGEKIAEAELTYLLDGGVDLHSYQPTVQDIAKISECDVFVYVGGESDKWVPSALKNARNKNMRVVNLLEVLGDRVRDEEVVEGMQADDDEDEAESDEHVWLSLKNAQILVDAIAAAISGADEKNSSIYMANSKAYCARLDALDKEYRAAVSAAKRRGGLFGDRFPFRYLTDDYGIRYFAAFAGCSAETEASFDTIGFLAKKLGEEKLDAVCQIESSDGKIPRTIIQTAKAKKTKILTFDSLQSTTSRDVKKGETYLGAMQKNLEILKTALN